MPAKATLMVANRKGSMLFYCGCWQNSVQLVVAVVRRVHVGATQVLCCQRLKLLFSPLGFWSSWRGHFEVLQGLETDTKTCHAYKKYSRTQLLPS